MGRWATVLVFDDVEHYNALVEWARARDQYVCTVLDEQFAADLQSIIDERVPPDRDMLAENGNVIDLRLNFVS